MDTRHRKTTLGDDAALYNNRENKTEKEKWEAFSKKEKIQYFKDYYLAKIIGICLVGGIIVSILVSIIKPKPEPVLQVALIGGMMTSDEVSEMTEELEKRFGLDTKKNNVLFDTGYSSSEYDYTTQEKLFVYVTAGELDVCIMKKSDFERLAGYGWFKSMDELLSQSEMEEYKAVLMDATQKNDDGSLGETYTLGIDVSGVYPFKQYTYSEPIILAVVGNIEEPEYAVDFIHYLFEKEK